MILQRKLNHSEMLQLLDEAPETETRNLKRFLFDNNMDAYEFFNKYGVENDGIVINSRPVYLASLMKNNDGEYELWTVVNSNVKEQKTLYKISKQQVHKWKEKYGEIYATMEKVNPKNIKWTQKLGFNIINESDHVITFKLSGVS